MKTTQVYGTGEKVGRDQKMAKTAVRRLFRSPTGWYKAEVVAPGVIDFVYWHRPSGRLVCGDANWGKQAGQAGFRFEEVVPVAGR